MIGLVCCLLRQLAPQSSSQVLGQVAYLGAALTKGLLQHSDKLPPPPFHVFCAVCRACRPSSSTFSGTAVAAAALFANGRLPLL